MFSSLRSRLLASYLLLTLAVLAVIGFGVLLFLIRNPLPTRQTYVRLNQALDVVSRLPSAAGEDPASLVRRADNTYNLRFLVFDTTGRVLADSRAAEGSVARLRRTLPRANGTRLGTFDDGQGQRWLIVVRPMSAGLVLADAAPQPPPGLAAILGDEILPPLVGASLVALLLSVLLAWLISRWVTSPLQHLARVTRQVAQGDLEQKIPREGPQELQDLQGSFQEMVRRIQSALRAQRALVADVSHELRTPLTSIQGYAQAILDGAAGTPEGVHQAAGVIHEEADRMRRLVEGLLDRARAEAGLAAIVRRPVDLAPVLRAAEARFGPRARERGVDLRFSVPSLPMVLGDADRLAQVADNLLDNALRHTPRGGQVALEARGMGPTVEFQVRDSGPGISAEALPHVFERFFRADREGRGAGLGLAICKEIVEAHLGQIEAHNPAGGGAAFVVRLLVTPPEGTTVVHRLSR